MASLTTVSTSHHGSKSMDILWRFPSWLFKFLAVFVNSFCRILGDKKPDFYHATMQYTTAFCKDFNETIVNSPEVYYQSYVGIMSHSHSDMIMSIPHFVVKRFDGDNDGLVSVSSAQWGEFKGAITGKTVRGVSHADLVDMRRRNIAEVDIREVYRCIVEDLKNKGF